jgi:DNA-binding LacI/PurR family transcriptional regulator
MGIPTVCSGRPLGRTNVEVPYVDVDQIGGVVKAVHHLLEKGRRRIATIAGPQDMVAGVDRLTGYRQALKDSDRRSIVAVGDFTRESGAVAMRQLLDDDPKLDAVFVASDLMAHGALRTLHEAGRRVPDDVAVIGFDDIEDTRFAVPSLSTIAPDKRRLAELAVDSLLTRIAGDPEAPHTTLYAPHHLVARESTTPASPPAA